ncbi:MAG: LuxR C-terminal-related transcriptional regulator [Terracoccus sp.]
MRASPAPSVRSLDPDRAPSRPRLTEVLDLVADPASTVNLATVCAPAGFGKTTALLAWVQARREAGDTAAWCDLDGLHATSRLFWGRLLGSIALAVPAAGDIGRLAAPRVAGDVDFLLSLADALADLRLVLVVENLHEVTEPGLLRDLDHLLALLPAGVTCVLTSRSDPPLQAVLAAKLAGTLAQLRAADLALTREELAVFAPDLTEQVMASVWEATEGWPAMVRLAVETARTSGTSRLDLVRDDPSLAQFLFHEAFELQTPATQDLLLRAAVPSRLPLELAVELTGRKDVGTVLDRVAQVSGLLRRSARSDTTTVYRFHPILRAYLGGELARRDSGLAGSLHRRTARWLIDHGSGREAIDHVVAANDVRFTAVFAREMGPALINDGDSTLLLGALQSARGRLGTTMPWSRCLLAIALLDTGHVDEAAAVSTGGPPGIGGPTPPGSDPELRAARGALTALLDRRRGRPCTRRELGAAPPSSDPDLRLLSALARGSALCWGGDLDAAEEELTTAVSLARGLGRPAALIDGLTFLGTVHASRSDFVAMGAPVTEALLLAEQDGWSASPRIALTHVLGGWLARQRLEDDRAAAHAARGRALAGASGNLSVIVPAEVLDAAIRFESSGSTVDLARLHAVWGRVAHARGAPGPRANTRLMASAALADVRYSLRAHRREQVEETRRMILECLGPVGEHLVTTALVDDACGNLGRARRTIGRVTSGAVPVVVPLTLLEAHVIDASLAARGGDAFAAVESARRAIELADRLGALRPLVDGGEPMTTVLRAHRGRWGAQEELVDRVLEHGGTARPVATTLSRRELDILLELPNLRTVDEIAGSMFLSVNTVKTHLRSIYRKLGVSSRRDAVAVARRAGLL